MKIVLVHEEYPEETNFGGIATYQKIVAEEYVRLGHEVTVICRGLYETKRYIENNVNIIRIFVQNTTNKRHDYIKYRKLVADELLKLQKSNKIDIIETPDWGAETIYFEKNRKVPLVVRLHTPLKIWLEYNKNNFGIVKKDLLRWENRMIHSADLVTCCSEALKKKIISKFKIEEENILVTPNPADITKFYYDEKIKKKGYLLFIGSLEERKGVITLAKALNIVLKKYSNLKIKFIGKDTNRNHKNISTIEYIKEIVKEENHKKIEFLGQIKNEQINQYLNEASVAIFPSLFDNFPYVVLEAMATGVHIVGSSNSGMVEMLGNCSSIFESGNEKDLALKIEKEYHNYTEEKINKKLIDRLNDKFNSEKICNKMLNYYKTTIANYHEQKLKKEDIQNILKLSNIKVVDIKKISYKKLKNGVANHVYKIRLGNGKNYIIKKYIYDYNFDYAKKLYKIYEKNRIKVVSPINKEIIIYNDYKYNVFEFYKSYFLKKVNIDYICDILICNRKTNLKSMLLSRVLEYYNYLLKEENILIKKEEINFVINEFKKIKDNKIFEESYFNHGDISSQNVITSKYGNYLIDFDETTITTELYDFAVIMVKIYNKDGKFNKNKFLYLKNKIMQDRQYQDKDFTDTIKFYLCKILLEKFYLHQTRKINLFSKRQQKDFYRKYLTLLVNVKELENQ